jgi:acyl-[acyl-carrier-protein] desaturase
VALERARMAQVTCGQVPEPPTPHDAILYVALQELATRISHFNTGKQLDDPAGYEVMKRVAADENLHHLFYRDLCSVAFELDPSAMVIALERQLMGFEMPGTGIVDFERHAKAIARAGIYDFAVHHELIVKPMVTRRWHIADLQGLTAEAERARDAVLAFVDRLGRAARRLTERRASLAPAG